MSQSSPFSTPTTRPVIAFMTDFGLDDGDVGVLKGVALGITAEAQLIDITHTVAPQNVASGAWILAASYRYFPRGTVFVCVVDPGVGSSRKPIAVAAGDWYFVGPDNGLFSYVFAEQTVHHVVTLSQPAYHLAQVSSTFHGRDIFTPVAAHIASGVALSELGSSVDPETLERLDLGLATRQDNHVQDARVLHVDHFGNIVTNIPLHLVPDLFTSSHVEASFTAQKVSISERRRFFSESTQSQDTQPFIYGDSSGFVGIAIRNGNAAHTLHVGYGAPMTFAVVQ
ncbi:MAG: SAM-dependent chlorinase/fluorinase [Ktedonobacteraceae bacterium]